MTVLLAIARRLRCAVEYAGVFLPRQISARLQIH